MEEKQETKKTIKISLRTAILVGILIVVMILAIIGLVTYIFIKDNKQENKIKNVVKQNKVDKEVEEVIQLTEFTPKSFEQKYVDLYNIVKGSEKVVNGITYSYRTNEVIDNALVEGIIELDVSDKLNIIANTIDVNEIKTVQDIKEIIKKYYGIEENGEFPERLDIITGKNQVTHFGKQDNNYQMQAKSIITNVGSYVLGLLDSVEDTGDTIVIKEKVVFANAENDEITFENGDIFLSRNKKIEQFDIGKYYDDLGSYEYTFKKNGDNYNLIDIRFKSAIEEKSYAYKHFKEGLEVETLLPKNQALKITSIEKNNEGKFVITGNVYEECIISKEELEDLKKGKTINLYGREYKYEYKKGIKEKNEVLDRDYEYEIEQLIPIDGSEGVYLINVFINTMGEGRRVIAKNNLEGVRLIYAHVEDLVERIGDPVFNYQEIINIDADTLSFEKKPVETKTITVNNIKGYGTYSSYYNEFYAQADDLEKIYNAYKEYGADYYYLNFIMKNGEEIEFWYNIG